jgi:hypothetical protein
MFKTTRNYLNRRRIEIPKYGLLLFDHSVGEYLSMAQSLKEEQRKEFEPIIAKREAGTITWKDIYNFKLILLQHYNVETLKSKITGLRIKYQCLVDVAEFNNYMSEQAVSLNDPAKPVTEDDKKKLQTDYTYLLDEFFLRYAYISAHEEFRTKLLWRGAVFTFCFFVLSGVVIWLSFNPSLFSFNLKFLSFLNLGENSTIKVLSTLIAVVFAGVMGAFVSMQERLQTFSHKGDPIYNLSLLTHGWLSIFLSPISGAIFAAILYLFFTGGFLTGTIFPAMTTLPDVDNPQSIVELSDFILYTGPKTGKDFALLLIWSFIAGFAERFVPDTLMRLVNQKQTTETAGT